MKSFVEAKINTYAQAILDYLIKEMRTLWASFIFIWLCALLKGDGTIQDIE